MRLPIVFSEVKNSNFDSSIIPVDIKVVHDGLNSNNSTFFEEAINDASNSLKINLFWVMFKKSMVQILKILKDMKLRYLYEGKTKLSI